MNKTFLYAFAALVAVSSIASADEPRRRPLLNPSDQMAAPAPTPAPVQPQAMQAPASPQIIAPQVPVAPLAAPQLNTTSAVQEAPVVGVPSTEGRTPLVIIRFNKPTVNYQDQLYTAVAEAVKVSPNVMFDVVGGSRTGEVVSTLNKIGVPQSRISSKQMAVNPQYDEVKVFVR